MGLASTHEHFQMRKRMSGIFYYDHFNGGGSSLRSMCEPSKVLEGSLPLGSGLTMVDSSWSESPLSHSSFKSATSYLPTGFCKWLK